MTLKELKQKSVSELHSLLATQRDALREMRFKDTNKQLKTVHQIRLIRTEIAQIMTLLNKQKDAVQPVQVKTTLKTEDNK